LHLHCCLCTESFYHLLGCSLFGYISIGVVLGILATEIKCNLIRQHFVKNWLAYIPSIQRKNIFRHWAAQMIDFQNIAMHV
jgi:hypothetical protein